MSDVTAGNTTTAYIWVSVVVCVVCVVAVIVYVVDVVDVDVSVAAAAVVVGIGNIAIAAGVTTAAVAFVDDGVVIPLMLLWLM